ncbi:MAG: SPOR domain-containing protein [Melioribacteraceae bacterium]
MTKAEFYNKIVEFLGVSFSERYLAGDLLIEKIAGSISQNQSLEIKNFGKFSKMENKNNSIVFVDNISEKPIKLTFEIKNLKPKNEIDEDTAFSLGVGKPLIPLKKDDEWGGELDTSLTILKKSLNERISEYLSKAVIKDVKGNDLHRGESSAFLNYTLEDDNNENENDSRNSDRDLINLLNDYSEISNPASMIKVEEDDSSTENENEFDQILKSMLSERDEDGNYSPPQPTELDEKDKEENIAWDWGDELKKEISLEYQQDLENDFLGHNEEIDIVNDDEDKFIDKNDDILKPKKEDLFEKLAKTIQQSESDIDKIKKNYEFDEEPYSEEGDDYKIEDENEEVSPKLSHNREINSTFENKKETEEKIFNEPIRKEPFGNNKVITLIGLAVILLVIAAGGYYFFFMKGSSNPDFKAAQKIDDPVEIKIDTAAIPKRSTNIKNDPLEGKVAKEKIGSDQKTSQGKSVTSQKVSDKKPVVSQKSSEKSTNQKGINDSKTPIDKKVANLIFYDGNNYNVQVSSWRNRSKAIDEVTRLKREGLSAFIVEAYLPEKGGNWYRVRVGNFKSINEAKTFLSKQK